MAEIAPPRPYTNVHSDYDHAITNNMGPEGGFHASSGQVELVPNPHFVFPAVSQTSHLSANTIPSVIDASSLPAQTLPSVAKSKNLRQRRTASALPSFSFNPGTTDNTSAAMSTPPRSPVLEINGTSARAMGHRRGGSEFIGGDGKGGGVGLMSTSPSKGDGVLPPPNSDKKLGPPSGRRGHAHRRSAAISNHDLSGILHGSDTKPGSRAGSAPVSPTFGGHSGVVPLTPDDTEPRSYSVPGPPVSQPDTVFNSNEAISSSPQRPPSRARVGFSDRIEYIRPLSTISSGTESSMSTVLGHSVTNSLSSIVSSITSSPSAPRTSRPPPITTLGDESRPSTAGAVLDVPTPIARDASVSSNFLKRPMSAISPSSPMDSSSMRSPVHSKRKIFTTSDCQHNERDVTTARNSSKGKPKLILESPNISSTSISSEKAERTCKKSQRNKPQKNPLRVKDWATSFMSRKARNTEERPKPTGRPTSSPTCHKMAVFSANAPPTFAESDLLDNFDIDDTVTIVSGTASPEPINRSEPAFWQPRIERKNSESFSPAIDLDAALGPFSQANQGLRSQGRGFSAARRTMHSSGSGVFTLGMQFHRRAESAPELVPFEYSPAQLSAASTMADVFEEDEEEAEKDFKNSGSVSITSIPEETAHEVISDHLSANFGIHVVEADESTHGSSVEYNFGEEVVLEGSPRHAESDDDTPAGTTSRDRTPTPTSVAVSRNRVPKILKSDSIDVVEAYEEPRAYDPATTPTPSPGPKDLSTRPLKIAMPLPPQGILTPDTASSSFPSPVLSVGPNIDTPRLSTATSSVTDCRTFSSAFPGDSGQDLRISVDDVPSLTSSRSTMTSALHNTFPALRPRAPSDRPSSLSSVHSVQSFQRRKRSSIASLSKLMGSSFGEKSKLHIEHRPQSEHGIEAPVQTKTKKKKRLSKLMQFWKSKDSRA